MPADKRVTTTCPECRAQIRYPRDATQFSCACGYERVKIRVALPIAWSRLGEFLWARPLGDDRYELDTIPLSAYGLNAGDVVRALVPLGRPEALPQVVEVEKASKRMTFWVRFLQDDSELAQGVLNRLPADVGRETGEGILALDALPEQVDDVLEVLRAEESSERLAFRSADPNTPGRFDNVYEDLLGEFFVRMRREGTRGTPAEENPPPEDLQSQAMEDYLLSGLGWPSDGPPRFLRLRPLTSQDIRARSGGRVGLPRTINPRSLAPKHGGLFSPEVWGHTVGPGVQGLLDTYGDFKRPLREFKGFNGPPAHIELPAPVRHPWLSALSLDAIPVLPPGCRAVFFLPGEEGQERGPLAVSDVNYLYMLLLDRTHQADVTPAQLQEAVDALFGNETLGDPFTLEGRPVASLRKQLGGSPGRDLADFDAGLGSGALELAGPLPKRIFYVLRALEAFGIGVDLRQAK